MAKLHIHFKGKLWGQLKQDEQSSEFFQEQADRRRWAPYDPYDNCWSGGLCDCDECRSEPLEPVGDLGSPVTLGDLWPEAA